MFAYLRESKQRVVDLWGVFLVGVALSGGVKKGTTKNGRNFELDPGGGRKMAFSM